MWMYVYLLHDRTKCFSWAENKKTEITVPNGHRSIEKNHVSSLSVTSVTIALNVCTQNFQERTHTHTYM